MLVLKVSVEAQEQSPRILFFSETLLSTLPPLSLLGFYKGSARTPCLMESATRPTGRGSIHTLSSRTAGRCVVYV